MDVRNYTFLQKLEQLPFIEKIWLYGSRARGDSRDRSDIDLAIECPSATFLDWQKALDIIENADTLLKIDCVRLEELKPDSPFKKHILRDRKLLFQRREYNLKEETGGIMIESRLKINFDALGKALERLKEAIDAPIDKHRLSIDATIQRFEFTMELFWKNFKNFLEYEKKRVLSPRDAVAQAYQSEWMNDEKLWLRMFDDRNFTSHNYGQESADDIYARIKTYYPEMKAVYETLKQLSIDP